jgi:hypothetical protein
MTIEQPPPPNCITETREPGEAGGSFKAVHVCGQCWSRLQGGDTGIALECFCGSQAALFELVELKRMKDAGGASPEYERRKAIAWREAFKIAGILEDPKP